MRHSQIDPKSDRSAGTVCRARARTASREPLPRSVGRPLEPDVRGRFERTFEHDFTGVRVHDDGAAAEAAASAGALAYTIGRDIVFGPDHYAPYSSEGARLLAHELVHVVQQDAAPRVDGVGGSRRNAAATAQAKRRAGPTTDGFEQEADRLAEHAMSASGPAAPALRGATQPQAQPDPRRRLFDRKLEFRPPPAPPNIQPGSIPEALVVPEDPATPQLETTPLLGEPRRPGLGLPSPPFLTRPLPPFTPMRIIPISRCIPDRPLTWGDFPATMPAGARFDAKTGLLHPLITVQRNEMFQLQLQSSSSVKAKVRNAASRAANGCAPALAGCKTWLKAHPGTTWNFTPPAQNPCPATVQASSATPATTPDECDTVLGPECDAAAKTESARILAHEQGHFDLGCVLVNKANDALRAGTPSATIEPRLKAVYKAQQAAYETTTANGCDATAQAAAEADIAAQLPAVTIP